MGMMIDGYPAYGREKWTGVMVWEWREKTYFGETLDILSKIHRHSHEAGGFPKIVVSYIFSPASR